MAGDDLEKNWGKGGSEGSATGVFGTMAKVPVKEEPVPVPVPPAAPVVTSPVPTTNASSEGFTQLLRALNYDATRDATRDAVKTAPAAAPVEHNAEDAGPGGPMTQLLRTISSGGAEAGVAEKPVGPPGASQVTSFLPGSAPLAAAVPTPAAAPAPAAAAPAPAVAAPAPAGSFTQLFERLEEPSGAVEPEMLGAAPSFTQLFAAPAVSAPAAKPPEPVPAETPAPAAPASAPGSFTQMFQTLSAPATGPALSGTSPGNDVAVAAQLPVTEPAAPTARTLVEPPAGAPGSFTQLFQALAEPEAEPVRLQIPPMEAEPATPGHGSFTQIFQALGTPATEETRSVPPAMAEASKPVAAATPGSFTQMFRTLDEEPKPKEPVAGPGSFTQLFEAPAPSSAPVVPSTPSAYERPFAASAPEQGESGASQIFATYKEPQAAPVERGPEFSPGEAAPARGAPASTPSSGGLTQLLRALDGPTPSPKPYAAPSYASPAAPTPQPGSFTGVYGELGAPLAPAAPAAPLAAAQTPVGAGPSEFTRLINASALREAGLRGGGVPAGAPAASAAAPSGGGGGFAMPGGLPVVPHASFATPAAPSASISGPAGIHASASAAGGGHASFAAPHLPPVSAASALKLPEIPKAGGTPAGMQKYLPLLLILVIFLLLAVLVAVVVLMKK